MELHVYLAFVCATAIMIALPGPSVLLTVAHSISFEWKHALSTVAGETMGGEAQMNLLKLKLFRPPEQTYLFKDWSSRSPTQRVWFLLQHFYLNLLMQCVLLDYSFLSLFHHFWLSHLS